MERRTALAYAAAAAGVAVAGSTAFAATSGMLGHDDPDPVEIEGISTVGDEVATATTLPEPTVMTVFVDEYVPAPATGTGPAVDDRGGLRPASVSDDAPDVFDDHGEDDDDWDDDHDDDRDDDDDHDDDHDEVEVEDD